MDVGVLAVKNNVAQARVAEDKLAAPECELAQAETDVAASAGKPHFAAVQGYRSVDVQLGKVKNVQRAARNSQVVPHVQRPARKLVIAGNYDYRIRLYFAYDIQSRGA